MTNDDQGRRTNLTNMLLSAIGLAMMYLISASFRFNVEFPDDSRVVDSLVDSTPI